MGAVQGKEDTINTNRTMVPPPPSTVQALQAMLSPSPPTDHTLDRTLKGFLRHCNLSGLEYRLRLAGALFIILNSALIVLIVVFCMW